LDGTAVSWFGGWMALLFRGLEDAALTLNLLAPTTVGARINP